MARWLKLTALGVLALTVTGCGGGGGGGSSGSSSTTPAAAVTTPTATTTPTASTTPSTSVAQGNALLITIPDITTGAIGNRAPSTGSQVTIGAPSVWAPGSTSDPNLPTEIKAQLTANPAAKLNARVVPVNVAGGGSGVPDKSLTGTQYYVTTCTPGTSGCATPNVNIKTFIATQDGKIVTPQTAVAGRPISFASVNIFKSTHLVQNGTTPSIVVNKEIPLASSATQWGVLGSLQHSYVGSYSDVALSMVLTGADASGNVTTSGFGGSVTHGAHFGGNATSTSDMAALKNTNVTANYKGYFQGSAEQLAPLTSLSGNSKEINAAELRGAASIGVNFGSGVVSGSIHDLKRTDINGVTAAAPYGIAVGGTITGTNYNGAAVYTAPGTTPNMTAVAGSPTGQMIGGFFGPNAAETAGVVKIEGTAPGTGAGTGANTVLFGGFGAKK